MNVVSRRITFGHMHLTDRRSELVDREREHAKVTAGGGAGKASPGLGYGSTLIVLPATETDEKSALAPVASRRLTVP